MENSLISWTNHTFNPVRGCEKVSAGCANCYAETKSARNPAVLGQWGNQAKGRRIAAVPSYWRKPLAWNRAQTESSGPRPRVFCASFADVFENWKGLIHLPDKTSQTKTSVAWWRPDKGIIRAGQTTMTLNCGEMLASMNHIRAELFSLIQRTQNLDWLLLTKRPENIIPMIASAAAILQPGSEPKTMLEEWLNGKPPHNVWLGTTAEDQQTADLRIPILLGIPAALRFVSCEPMLGSLALDGSTGGHDYLGDPDENESRNQPGIDWIIAGGESGSKARPMHPDWARSLRDQCAVAGVPFHFKQWGEWVPIAPLYDDHDESAMDGTDPDRMAVLRDDGTTWPLEWGQPPIEGNPWWIERVGAKHSGRLLDGREHNQFPQGGAA